MTQDIDPADVRVMYSHARPYMVLLPLGCYHVGQTIDLPKHGKVTVTQIDPDGAAVARTDEQMQAARASGRDPFDRAFRSRPGWTIGQLWSRPESMERVQAGMDAQQARNRREHGVVLPADIAAAA